MFKKRSFSAVAKAFTLLEMLFVIVILSFLLLAWVLSTQKNATQRLVDETSRQMLSLLESSRSYFMGKLFYWPNSFDDLTAAGYLTSGQIEKCSLWQKSKNSDPSCNNGTHEVYQMYWSNSKHQNATQFGISIVLPNEQIAKDVAATIPMYRIEPYGGFYKLTALTTIPAPALDLKGRIIKMGTVMNNQIYNNFAHRNSSWTHPRSDDKENEAHGYVRKPNCPAPLKPAIFFAPYDYMLATGLAKITGSNSLSMESWCETGKEDDNDTGGPSTYKPTQGKVTAFQNNDSCSNHNGPHYPAYAGPQHCDYAPDLNAYPDYWRLNYWACTGQANDHPGIDASIIYFTTCLQENKDDISKSQFHYPGVPFNDTLRDGTNATNMNLKITCGGGGVSSPLKYQPAGGVGCFYPTSCAFKNSAQKITDPAIRLPTCHRKRRRCANPIWYGTQSLQNCKSGY